MAHDVAQRRDVIFRLAEACRTRESQFVELAAQFGKNGSLARSRME